MPKRRAQGTRKDLVAVLPGGNVLAALSDEVEEHFPGRLDVSRFSHVEYENGLWVARRDGKKLCQAITRKKCLELEHAVLMAWLASPSKRAQLILQMGQTPA